MSRFAPIGRSALFALGLSALAGAAQAGFFPTVLSGNTTGFADNTFLGPPDDVFLGIGGKTVTYDFGVQAVVNRPGLVDFNVYEVDFGAVESASITVWARPDGITFTNVSASAVTVVAIAGDEAHGSSSFARSYDLGALSTARYIMIDGNGDGAAGPACLEGRAANRGAVQAARSHARRRHLRHLHPQGALPLPARAIRTRQRDRLVLQAAESRSPEC